VSQIRLCVSWETRGARVQVTLQMWLTARLPCATWGLGNTRVLNRVMQCDVGQKIMVAE
jgi:hypothetical protein